MFRSPQGDDGGEGIGFAGEILASPQTTVPGPAARPRPKASQRLEPCPIRPDTRPVAVRASRASAAWVPETTVPMTGPLPATAVTVVSVPRWAVTSQVWVGE